MHRRVVAGALCLLACTCAYGRQSSPGDGKGATDPTVSTPLPDFQAVLTRVRARYDALESLRKNYMFTVTRVADEFSGDGSKKTHTDVYQAFYVGNTAVYQHISRDGKPLSPDDAKKEQERVDKQVAKLKAGESKPPKNELSLSRALKVVRVAHAERQIVNGRPTLVYDYVGDPHANADTLGEEIMRDLAGQLWVDERDDAIVRFTGKLEENFHVAGGLLVNIRKGSWLDLTQSHVNGEIWFPAEFRVHVDGRFLLLKGFNGDMRETYSDYRKMKTSVTILPGTPVLDEPGKSPPDMPQTSTTEPEGASPKR